MAYHDEIESLNRELAELRALLMSGRERVRPRLNALIQRTQTLHDQPSQRPRDAAVGDLLERLLAYQRGFEVGDCVRAARSSRRRR